MITRWNGFQLELRVVEAGSIQDAMMQNTAGSYDPQIIKIEEISPVVTGLKA